MSDRRQRLLPLDARERQHQTVGLDMLAPAELAADPPAATGRRLALRRARANARPRDERGRSQ
jgi:hypothetical protein